jgi:hypothetical protein
LSEAWHARSDSLRPGKCAEEIVKRPVLHYDDNHIADAAARRRWGGSWAIATHSATPR